MKLHLHLKAVLCFAALLTGLQVLAYDFEANGLYYEITETPGTVSVTRNNDVKYSGAIVVPSTVKHDGTTYTVTSIGVGAFYGSDITSIDMPNTITSIGYQAFEGCVLLTEVEIPESVVTIEFSAFQGCSGINKPVVIPDGVKGLLNSNLFRGCTNLPSVTIGTGITTIGAGAFEYCTNLKELIIKDSDEPLEITRGSATGAGFETAYIGRNIGKKNNSGEFYEGNGFIDVQSLKSVTFGDKVTAIYDYTLNSCNNLESITFGSGLKSIGAQVVHCMKLTSPLVFPSGLESIGDYAFSSCGITGEVVLPDALTSLGRGAFNGCSGISSLTIGTGLTELSLTAIKGCSGLKEVIFKDTKTPIHVDGSEIDVPYNIETAHIGRDISVVTNGRGLYSLFEDCTTLHNVTIGNNVTALSDYAFSGCTALASIDIPNNVTKIGTSAFSHCTSLTSLTLPAGVTDIGSSTFSSSGLRSIVLPDGITDISYTFAYCNDLTSVSLPDALVSIGYGTFNPCIVCGK